MAAMQPSGETPEQTPLEKCRLFEDMEVDNVEAELDDEVEKELREFEKLQSGLLSTSAELGNCKDGGTNRSQIAERVSNVQEHGKKIMLESHVVERENPADGSDMELDDLEEEIAQAKEKNTTKVQHTGNQVPNRNQHPVLNETVPPEDIGILPDTFAEENLLGDNPIGKSGILENEEEHCLEMDQVQLSNDSKIADPLFTSDQDSRAITDQTTVSDTQELLRSAQEILRSRQNLETEYLEEDPNDPDFPSPGKRKSRARSNRSKSRRSQQWQFSPESQATIKIGNDPSKVEQFVPKIALFVDPHLKKPVQPTDTDFQDQTFGHVSKPNDHHTEKEPGLIQSRKELVNNKVIRDEQLREEEILEKTSTLGQHHVNAIDFDQTTTQNYEPLINAQNPRPKSPLQVNPNQDEPRPTDPKPPKHPVYLEYMRNPKNLISGAPPKEPSGKMQASSPTNLSDAKTAKVTIDITCDQPIEYCAVESIIQRKFKNSSLIDDEKLDIIHFARPEIWRPELFPYVKFYESQKWMAACNELKKFFCWPCLFFASKVIWSVNCDENSEIMIGKEIKKHQQSLLHQESVKQLDALKLKNKSSVVNDLLCNDFVNGTWTDENRESIIIKGRPQPILDHMADRRTKYEKVAFQEFYNKFRWVCGCNNLNKFSCWPCLLFSSEKWTYAGSPKSVESALLLHEATKPHMAACFNLGKWEFDLLEKSKVRDEEIEKTRIFVKCLVEILCAEKKKINNVEFSPLDFVDSLELMSRYNKKLRIFIDEHSKNSNILQIVTQYTTGILESVEYFVKGSILEEIKTSSFVSLIFDHSSGLSNKAILSVIARYVDGKGQIHERFVKLLNVGYNTPSNMLIDEFFQIIIELQCRSTLIGFTYDGYFVKPGSIPDFNAKVQKFCPNAKFFHYKEHNFKRVLKQTLCHVPVCRRVLQAVKELASFFETTPNARKGLSDIVTAAEKTQGGDVWRSANFITTVFIYHAVIIEIMESITKNAQDWKMKTVVQASNFLDFFKDSTNRFYITIMVRMFDAVNDLSKEVEKDVGVENLKTIASHTVLKIQKLGRNFDNLIESACSCLEKSEQDGPRQEMSNLQEQFSNVVRLVVKLVKNRIVGLGPGYFKIVNEAPSSDFEHFFIKLKRQNQFLRITALPPNFNSTRLAKELKFIHESPIFLGFNISDIVEVMSKYNTTYALPELFKFLQMALTVPNKEYDSTIPAVRRISAFIEGKKDIDSTDALIWMEKEFISNLQKNTNFYEQITDCVMAITKKDSFRQYTK